MTSDAKSSPLRVVVCGAAGAVGGELMSQLDADAEIDAVIGLDTRDPPASHRPSAKTSFRRIDLAGSTIEDAFRDGGGAAAPLGVYLAPLAVGDTDAAAEMDDGDLARRFLEACGQARASAVVVASGSAVYDVGRQTTIMFAEGAPLRPRDFPLGEADFERERLCAEFARRRPDTAVALCRLAHVVGPGTRGIAHGFLTAAKLRVAVGMDPPLQFVHVVDVSQALFRLLKGRKTGVYNVAPDDFTTLLEVGRACKRPLVRVSPSIARLRAWVGDIVGGASTLFARFLEHPVLLSNRKVKRETGYVFRYGTQQAVSDHARRDPPAR